jgi:hypothetical protein
MFDQFRLNIQDLMQDWRTRAFRYSLYPSASCPLFQKEGHTKPSSRILRIKLFSQLSQSLPMSSLPRTSNKSSQDLVLSSLHHLGSLPLDFLLTSIPFPLTFAPLGIEHGRAQLAHSRLAVCPGLTVRCSPQVGGQDRTARLYGPRVVVFHRMVGLETCCMYNIVLLTCIRRTKQRPFWAAYFPTTCSQIAGVWFRVFT